MSRVCHFTGRRTTSGQTYTTRGKAKYLGGVGTKVTGKTKRRFKPNIQTVTAVLPNGSIQRIKVSAKAIRSGLVIKPLKRRYGYPPPEHDTTQLEPAAPVPDSPATDLESPAAAPDIAGSDPGSDDQAPKPADP